MRETVRVPFAALQNILEGLFWQEADILGEHGEQAAHEEHGDFLWWMLLPLERLGDGRQPFGDGSRHLSGVASRIERQRVCPDANQSVPDFGPTKILNVDTVGSPIGELVERLPISAEIRIDLEAVADIAHDYEWRRLMTLRQEMDVVLGLSARVEHEYVPGTLSTSATTWRRVGDRQIE